MKRKLVFWLSLLAFLAGLGAAAYSYTGPNRTVTNTYTTNERRVCYWEAQHPDLPNGPRCFLKLYYSPSDSCPYLDPRYNQGYFNANDCRAAWQGIYGCPASGGRLCTIGWQNTWTENCTPGQPGCTSVPHTTTTTYPPATVSGSTTCAQAGNNGWCRGGASLGISANEPLSGYVITGIESNLGMLCSTNSASVTCSWSPPEGASSLDFWARSSYGDTSAMQSASFQVDTVSPDLTLSAPDPDGLYGWFVSLPVVVSATASDSTSGLASLQGQLDGGTWQTGSISIATDGIHDLTYRAEDRAGNVTTWEKRIIVDTQLPALSISIPESDGFDGWHVSPVTVHVDASDLLSGVQEDAVSVDGGTTWQATTTLQDGSYTVLGRATDVAGNTSTTSASVKVDTLPPQVQLDLAGTQGNAGWYTSLLSLTIQAEDPTSGVASIRVLLDTGDWQDASSLVIPDGLHIVQVRVSDQAGNVAAETRKLAVDTLPPQSEFTDPPEGSTTFVSGQVTFSGGSQDTTSGLAGAEISLDNGQSWQALAPDASGDWSFPWDTTTVPNGTYTILVRAMDLAGNQENTARVTVVVSNPPPLVTIPERWQVSESVPVTILPQGIPLGGARLTVSDPRGHWPAFVEEYTAGNLPAEIRWNGLFSDGTVAPPGEYAVTLEAWDIFGNTGSDAGKVVIPAPPTPTPTYVPTALPFRTARPSFTLTVTASSTPTATPTQTTTALPTQTAVTTPSLPPAVPKTPEAVPAPKPALLWPVIGLVALLAALASASLSDSRPRALRLLGKALDSFLGKPL